MSMQTGNLFDIVRNSFVDGPGIRTTVFFKGCNLKCAWCHNPESQSAEKEMMFYKNKCTLCGKCREVCRYHLEKCDFCGRCALYCPKDARKICGEKMSADTIFSQIEGDKAYYENSGGGVTFSGGECMLQMDFLEELLKKCWENHIHTAIDTAGNVPWESFERVIPYTDLFLYDVKILDNEKHVKYTGVPNTLILSNLKRLFALNASIWIRVPVIGGVNDAPEEMSQIQRFLSDYQPERVEYLPYHAMGEHKYEALGRSIPPFRETQKA